MRVIVCDDDAVVVSSLAIVLGAQPDIEVAGTASSGEEAVRLAAELAPDIVLLDIQMPGTDGLTAAERILAVPNPPRVVFLTTFSDDEYIVRALALGAAGYLIKQDVAGVAPALRAVAAGQSVLEGEVLERAGVCADDVDRFVYHQANKRIVDYSVKKLGLDPAKCEGNIDHTGNTSAGSVPILLDELVRAGELGSGSRVLMAGFGAGLTWAGALAEFA